MKTCTKCGEDKPLTEFSPRGGKQRSEELRPSCKVCCATAARAHYAANKHQHWLRAYGLTQEAYDALNASQDGRCAICRQSHDRALWVDHCHDSGKVRGLLCPACNNGLGMFGDDPARVLEAHNYLNRDSS